MRIRIFFTKFLVAILTLMMVNIHQVGAKDFFQSLSNHSEGNYSGHVEKKKPARKISQEEKKKNDPNALNVPQKEIKKKEKSHSYGTINLSLMPSFLTINGTQRVNGTRGTLNSEMFPAIRLTYFHRYYTWILLASGTYKRVTFEQSDDRLLANPEQTLLSADFQVAKAFGSFVLGFGGGREGRILYRSTSTMGISIERRIEDRIWLLTDFSLFKNEDSSVRLALRGGMNPAAHTETYDIERGYFYSAHLKVEHSTSENSRVALDVYYKHNDYKTNELKLNSAETGIGLSFSFDIGAWK